MVSNGGAPDMNLPPVARWLLLAALVYGGATVLARWLAARAMFHPDFASGRAPAGLRKIPGDGGTEVAVLHLPNPGARFTLWFFHGNAEDLGDLEPALQALRDAGFAVFAHDYPGYGFSSGRPSEASLYAAARAARRYLRETLRVPAADTILYGRSLGGGPAIQMAVEEPVAGLVLQSSFTSIYRVMTQVRLLPFDYFENERKLPRVGCPVLVIHGRDDEVIPFRHGEALFAAAREPKRALWIEGAGHNNLGEGAGPRLTGALEDFARLCAAVPVPGPAR